jgi:glycogen operon protein
MASINFIAAHDGFTLADLVSHASKHNEANGEGNRDGENENHSWNNGAEGPTGDPAILAARDRDRRALLATLFLSRGVPMLTAGDEIGRTQHGNNNAYCQDNAALWLDWKGADRDLAAFVADLTALRAEHPLLSASTFLSGTGAPPDARWLRPDGMPIADEEWGRLDAFGLLLNGDGESLLIAVNRSRNDVTLSLPDGPSQRWQRLICSAMEGSDDVLPARSVNLFGRRTGLERAPT